MSYTILDCYTDEPAGLGVPPYLGTYPRYLFGAIKHQHKETPYYLTIDDLRLFHKYNSKKPDNKNDLKTKIKVYNLTKNYDKVEDILNKTKTLVIIAGIHTPGKYLSAVPGTLNEVMQLTKDINCKRVLTGPAATIGSRLEGGKFIEKVDLTQFEEVDNNYLGIENYNEIQSIKGAEIVKQIPALRLAEIETGRGCNAGKCSFCTEPMKHDIEFREQKDILAEITALKKQGIEHFRLGKQSCFYSYKNGKVSEIEKLLKPIKAKTLHIDNVNPNNVISEDGIKITKLVIKYCTPGNVAAFGIESFDKEVIKRNHLNTRPETAFKAIQILNKYGAKTSPNGMPYLLPGINILFGLIGETKKTFEANYHWLKKILDHNLLIRRINIRQVVPFPGTYLYIEAGNKFLRKNRKHYWKWRNTIRQDIDYPMLKRLLPIGSVMKDVYTEIYDGKTTFGRQLGTYPLIVGIKGRHELNKFVNIKVTNHMLRSVTGEII